MTATLLAPLFGLTLDEAKERALANAPELHKASANYKASKADVLKSEAAFHPQLSANFQWQKQEEKTAFSKAEQHTFGLTASYNLFNGMSDYYTRKATKKQSKIAKYQKQALQSDLRLNVTTAYAAVLNAAHNIATQKESLASLTKQYEDAKVRFELGAIPKNELLQIDVRRLNTSQALMRAESAEVRARAELNRVMGGTLDANETLKALPELPIFRFSPQTMREAMYDKRSELKSLKAQRKAAKYSRKATFGGHLPKVDLTVNHTIYDEEQRFGTTITQPEDQTTTTLKATWNLYEGRSREAQLRRQLKEIAMVDADIDTMRLKLAYQFTDAYESYRLATSALHVAKLAYASAEENFRIVSERHGQGSVDTVTLLDARADLTSAKATYDAARYERYVSFARLERVTGE